MSEVTILQVVPRLEAGGSEQSTIEIAEALTAAGAKALVASEGGRLVERLENAGGELIRLPLASKNPLTILANAQRLAELVEARDVSLLHARSRAPAWSAFLAARRTGRPFVTTYHGAYRRQFPLKQAYNGVMARGDRVIANSRYTAEIIAARHGVPMERMRVIHRGLDIAQFARDAIAPARFQRLRDAWGIEEGCPVILQAARLTRLKGHTHTIEAARLLQQTDKVLIVGAMVNPNFIGLTNLANVATRAAFIAIIAVGATFVISSGDLDLSVGSMMGHPVRIEAGGLKSLTGRLAEQKAA